MNSLFTKTFWLDTLERALSTGAQALLTLMSLDGTNIVPVNFDWKVALSTFGFAALYAVLKALVASSANRQGTASFLNAVEYDEHSK